MRNPIEPPTETTPECESADFALSEPFVHALLAIQERLYAYLLTLLQNPEQAEEVLQETNLVLCQQADQFVTIKDFTGWACRIGYYEVLTYRKRCQRDRLTFNDELLGKVAEQATVKIVEFDQRKNALNHCLARLSNLQRNMIMQRYSPNGSVKMIAEEYNRSVGSISQSLYRIRTSLMECIQRTLATSE